MYMLFKGAFRELSKFVLVGIPEFTSPCKISLNLCLHLFSPPLRSRVFHLGQKGDFPFSIWLSAIHLSNKTGFGIILFKYTPTQSEVTKYLLPKTARDAPPNREVKKEKFLISNSNNVDRSLITKGVPTNMAAVRLYLPGVAWNLRCGIICDKQVYHSHKIIYLL